MELLCFLSLLLPARRDKRARPFDDLRAGRQFSPEGKCCSGATPFQHAGGPGLLGRIPPHCLLESAGPKPWTLPLGCFCWPAAADPLGHSSRYTVLGARPGVKRGRESARCLQAGLAATSLENGPEEIVCAAKQRCGFAEIAVKVLARFLLQLGAKDLLFDTYTRRDGRKDGRIDRQTHRQTDRQAYRQTDRRLDPTISSLGGRRLIH